MFMKWKKWEKEEGGIPSHSQERPVLTPNCFFPLGHLLKDLSIFFLWIETNPKYVWNVKKYFYAPPQNRITFLGDRDLSYIHETHGC